MIQHLVTLVVSNLGKVLLSINSKAIAQVPRQWLKQRLSKLGCAEKSKSVFSIDR